MRKALDGVFLLTQTEDYIYECNWEKNHKI
jgi:hypothetical protein